MKLKQFASSGSCEHEEKIIKGKVINDITFVSNEFSGTMNGQHFWDNLREFAKQEQKFIKLMY